MNITPVKENSTAVHAKFRPSVDRRFVEVFAEAINEFGIDAEAACRREGVHWPLAGEDDRIELGLMPHFYELMSRSSPSPDWNFQVVDLMKLDRSLTLFNLLLCCETSEEAMRLGCRYASVNSDVCSFTYRETDHGIDVLLTPTKDLRPALEQLEFALYLASRYRRVLPEANGRLISEIWFRHQPRFDPARYEVYFGCPVRFGAPRYGLRCSRESLNLRIPGGDARRLAYVAQIADRHEFNRLTALTLPERVRMLFMQRMPFGEPSVDEIAAALAISRRTLHRRLQDAGRNWRDITDAARMQVAHRELSDPERQLREIALLTGYADIRAFLRAFQRWAGMTPSQYRTTHFLRN